ncbi:hypothetical protein VP01_2945g2 [Puccinia sorghi]|uniref:Uncharacterized protein n=1 Tax=Puccinia sorghi TaxID=27349 RepID=A0A0L6V113_9BASI|nr:hypothetical protein VP01_2945g2 [Puccinia sorghi]
MLQPSCHPNSTCLNMEIFHGAYCTVTVPIHLHMQRGGIWMKNSSKEALIVQAFQEAQISLTLTWNYDPNVFYKIPQTTKKKNQPISINGKSFFCSSLGQCQTTLKHHQFQALQFLLNNKCANNNKVHDFWMHLLDAPQQQLDTRNLQTVCHRVPCHRVVSFWLGSTLCLIRMTQRMTQSNLEPEDGQTAPCQGSILAENMVLGKTLTTLMFVLGTSHMARDFQRSNLSQPPKSRLTSDQGLSHKLFYMGKGNPQHTNQFTIESLAMSWYQIVLDEAQYIIMVTKHHTEPKCQQNSPFPETPFSTHVVPQWGTFPELAGRCSEFDQPSQDLAVEPGLNLETASHTWNECWQLSCRLDLETASHTWNECWQLSCSSEIEPHDGNFKVKKSTITAGKLWNPTKFFEQLTRIWQYYLGKLVHLVQHLKGFLNGDQRARRRPKAASFYSYEPAWNPGMEAQAVDRLHRLGQAHEVHVFWYFVQGTLEINIHKVQRRKGELAVYVLSEPIVTCMRSLTDGWILHFLVA